MTRQIGPIITAEGLASIASSVARQANPRKGGLSPLLLLSPLLPFPLLPSFLPFSFLLRGTGSTRPGSVTRANFT